ncbi:MAG: homocysteine S-methyltransferase family protein [Synergistaceae bacterium]|nr:homocysteine S-methyltransferase family protein [Synergistaceae bacterium]
MNVREWIKNDILLFDGAMGTMLHKFEMKRGTIPETLNISSPDVITEIHKEYVQAGSDVVTTNTFQANELKLGSGMSVEEIVSAAVSCAKDSGARYTALDVGPLGQLMAPLGTVSFESAYEIFKRQMIAGEKAGADLIIIETISDLYEAKAAVLAAKENTGLPVFCTMSFQEDGRTFLGCDPLTAVMTLQGLGVDALGVNCSLGPELLLPVVDVMLKYSRLPVIFQPNAGLPIFQNGEPVYESVPVQYAVYITKMVRRGVRIAGGCCGTTPEYIRIIKEQLNGMKPVDTAPLRVSACTSGNRTVILDGATTEIGERLNPTGKKKLQEALRTGDTAYLVNEAISQEQAGAQILDVNVSLPELDEPATMAKVIRELQEATGAPLQIDSSDPAAIEAGLRVYNGKPIINSVNGNREVMEKIFPLANKYGALVVGLTLDEDGIPPSAIDRLEIARRIRDTALLYGVSEEDLLIDCLVLTASAQQAQVKETLLAIKLVKELGLKTVLGVSNVSFGLPGREIINAAFLASALGAGLDAAIINPLSARYREILDAYRVLNNEDRDAVNFIAKYSGDTRSLSVQTNPDLTLAEIIERGRKDEAEAAVKKRLEISAPLEIIDGEFIPALNRIGKRFEAGEIFLPQLMQSAQAVQRGFAVIKDHMKSFGGRCESKGRILLATVHGDIHDIGKNIVSLILESYGYEIIDMGKDAPVQKIIDAIREHDIRLAGLSALMTTTMKSMKETIKAAHDEKLECAFFVGGAALNKEYAEYAGADYYAKDAMEGVTIANRFFNQRGAVNSE